ncbi:hypothetical protein ElyMa_005547400 [Elysia marginata]|uniref:Uncharacterized protein n=1 Tax=Elysia marginata TaxID=1093978 RepID=A0AAV4EZ94_9GAST|nr:hypothetical protein ElyMa_005547400 [Elysia marginata]
MDFVFTPGAKTERLQYMRNLRRLQGITWQNRVTNTKVLAQAGMPSLFTIFSQKRLRWLGHVCRMAGRRIPKDFLHGELASGSRRTGRPTLCFKDVCKKDLKTCRIQLAELEVEV